MSNLTSHQIVLLRRLKNGAGATNEEKIDVLVHCLLTIAEGKS